jgi:hypothetical protein
MLWRMGERRLDEAESRADEARIAHSIVEERLYILTLRCECGAGPLVQKRQTIAHEGARIFDVVSAQCPRCERERTLRFEITGFFGRFYPRRAISDRSEPSHLLDRVAWVRWARLYLRAFSEGPGAGAARVLGASERIDCGVLAMRCLDEALKFFGPGRRADGEAGLHSPGSASAYREAPERYGRIEILGLKLQAAMMLAAAGIDPDDPDAGSGALAPVLPGTPARSGAGGAAAAGPAKAAALGGGAAKAALAALPGREPVKLLAPPAEGRRESRGGRGLLLALAVAAVLGVLALGGSAAFGLVSGREANVLAFIVAGLALLLVLAASPAGRS